MKNSYTYPFVPCFPRALCGPPSLASSVPAAPPAWCRFLSLAHLSGNWRERGSPVPRPASGGRAHVYTRGFKPATWQIYLLRIIPKICHVIGCRGAPQQNAVANVRAVFCAVGCCAVVLLWITFLANVHKI